MHHWLSICYVQFFAGVPVPLWLGDLAEAALRFDMLRDRTGGNSEFPGFNLFARIYATVVRLRQDHESDALTAACIELCVQYPAVAALGE
jgi:hypothetical protein